jgi:hypothetical protein
MLFSTAVVLFWKLGKNEVYNHGVNLCRHCGFTTKFTKGFLKMVENHLDPSPTATPWGSIINTFQYAP